MIAEKDITVPKNVITKRRRYFNSIRPQIINFFKDEDEYQCSHCQCEEELEVHHIVPLSKGGKNDVENLTILCHDHHMEVHRGKIELDEKGCVYEY